MSAESDPLSSPDHQPTRALLLAQALDACIQAERHVPGSAGHLIARQPAWARAELRRLVSLASSLDATASSADMSEEFRVAARARLMHRIAPGHCASLPLGAPNTGAVPAALWLAGTPSRNGHLQTRAPRRRWIWRGGIGGLLAAGLLAAATLTASANALPGEPLYSVKQVREEIGLRLARDDQARALVLLNQADMRLDETARLLQEGREDQVAQSTQRFDAALDRATTTFVVTIDDGAASADPLPDVLEARLAQQQQELQRLLASAPEPARAGLRQALVATERSRALVAEPQPADRRASSPNLVAAAPTAASEVFVEPTRVPEEASGPPPVDILAEASRPPIADDPGRHEGRGFNTRRSSDGVHADVTTAVANRSVVAKRQPPATPEKKLDRHLDRVDDAQLVPGAEVDVDDGLVAAPQPFDARDAGHGGDHHDDVANQRAPDKAISTDDHDHVAAPPTNQGDAHERVAEQSAAPPQTSAVTTQRRSGNNDSHDGEQQPVVADSSGGGGHAAAVTHDDGAQLHPELTPLVQAAHTQASSPSSTSTSTSSTGDRRGSGSASGSGSGSGSGSASVTTDKSDGGGRASSTTATSSTAGSAGSSGGGGATSGGANSSGGGDHHQSGGGH